MKLRAFIGLLFTLGFAATPLRAGEAPAAPANPSPEEMQALNNALKKAAVDADRSLAPALAATPGFNPLTAPRGGGRGAQAGGRRGGAGGGGGEAAAEGPVTFLPADQLPPGAKFAGPQDPAYVAQSQANPNTQPRQMEKLGRGVVAVNQGGKVWIAWRLLGTDPDDTAFNVYRSSDSGPLVKLNAAPIGNVTYFIDENPNLTEALAYYVRPVRNGVEGETSKDFLNRIAAMASDRAYFEVPLTLPERTTPNDASVGDLDGDGEYEIVLKSEQQPRDTASSGTTGNTILQGYKMDGTLMWTIQMGRNVREGAHYTQHMVYDLDGDGRAEIAAKTADGTVDGAGKVIGDPEANWVRADGKIQDGPEYFTIFDGLTGKALATKEYVPTRYPTNGWGGVGGNGGSDAGGNRNDRFTACIAYLDGVHPSVVMGRGYYGRSVLAAWDWRDGQLTQRWVFDSENGDNPYSGQGAHGISVGDVDQDGRDEIIFHAAIIDDNGKGLYSTGFRHGDALHAGAFDPARPNTIQVFGIHENEGETARFGSPGVAMYDGKTGATIWKALPGADMGRGVAADIDPRYPGYEAWGNSGGIHTMAGERIPGSTPSVNFVIQWDGDVLTELLNSNYIEKWNWQEGRAERIFVAEGAQSNNGSKSTPTLSGDIFGDWREEVILRSGQTLRIYTSTIPTEHRIFTLMHDPMYRLAIAWQNVAYNQPPHTGFYIGEGMKFPVPRPNITVIEPKPAP